MKAIMLVVACCAAAVGFCEPGQAEFEKGNASLNGTGVPQDPVAAFAWFRKSAVKGYLPAETEIGRCYEFGIALGETPRRRSVGTSMRPSATT